MASRFRRTFTYVDGNNDEKKIVINGNSQAEVDKKFQEFLQTPANKEEKQITLNEFVETIYVPTFLSKLGDMTRINYRMYLDRYILPILGERMMCDITVADVQKLYDYLADGKRNGFTKNINFCTIERVGGLLGRLYYLAMDMKYVTDTPVKKKLLRIDAEEASHHKALPNEMIDDIKKNIVGLEDEQERIYMALLAYTGMRREEILGLRWEDIDFAEGMIHVTRAVIYPGHSKPVVKKTKTRHSVRYVILVKPLEEILYPLKKKEGFLMGGDAPYAYSTISRIIRKAFKKLNIIGYNNHDFRTTFGTQLKEQGVSTALIADLMGHADTRMVETVYAPARKESIESQREVLEKMNSAYLYA